MSSHNQKKDSNEFKNKKQPKLPENQTTWKSDNQGVKEETFIQTCKRGGDRQCGQRGHVARWPLEEGVGKVVAGRVGGPTFAFG